MISNGPRRRATQQRITSLRHSPRTSYIQWAVRELGGRWQPGWGRARGFQGYIIAWPSAHRASDKPPDANCRWYPIQVKQKDKAGRPDIDAFEAMMTREDCAKGFFVSFDFTGDAETEVARFFTQTGKVIVLLTVRQILDEKIAHRLA